MSINTTNRILSALVLLLTVGVAFFIGKIACLALMLIIGILLIDEVITNFYKLKRLSWGGGIAYSTLAFAFVYLALVPTNKVSSDLFIYGANLLNLIFLIYLFGTDTVTGMISRVVSKVPFVIGIVVFIYIMVFVVLLDFAYWREMFAILVITNIGMDTGAWLFGSRFGKHKLWERVSPKKTVEGLIGGMVVATLFGTILWYYIFNKFDLILVALFVVFGVVSHLGDLVQSKLKRHVGIKDSSGLIPGHGGVYDRVDSLIFVAPVFALAISFFHLG